MIEPVKKNVADAKFAVERGDCQHAIELLGGAIEVGLKNSILVKPYFSMQNQYN